MSKIGEQLQDLRASIDNIKENMKKIKIENTLLQKQQENLVSEKAELVKKNEAAKEQIEAILERIKNIG
jgi:cell division protein ZapB